MLLLMATVLVRQVLFVAENRRLLETVADQALRDPLTSLANRVLFGDRLAHAVAMHAATHATSPCCPWIWTTSNSSTTVWVKPSATQC